jgi:hypothetical protein
MIWTCGPTKVGPYYGGPSKLGPYWELVDARFGGLMDAR